MFFMNGINTDSIWFLYWVKVKLDKLFEIMIKLSIIQTLMKTQS